MGGTLAGYIWGVGVQVREKKESIPEAASGGDPTRGSVDMKAAWGSHPETNSHWA